MGNAIKILIPVGGIPQPLIGASIGPISSGGANLGGLPQPPILPYIPTLVGPFPKQIAGLVPLLPCGYSDCRDTQSLFCYLNPVFGQIRAPNASTYENDINSFFVNYVGPNTVQFIIEKQTNNFYSKQGPNEWKTVLTITDNTYGNYYPLGSIAAQASYAGFSVNWGAVLTDFGQGIYRISVNMCEVVHHPSSLTISITMLPASILTGGYMEIGSWVYPVIYSSLTPATLIYLAGIINSSGICQASVVGGSLQVTGPYQVVVKLHYAHTTNFSLQGGARDTTGFCECALQSEPFILKKFNCDQAHGTVKFETWNSGTLGDVDNDGSVFNLCGLQIYDSIRMRGFFGYTDFDYDEVMVEWGINNTEPFGLVERVRDKAVRGYKFNSNQLPQWLHNRFATVGWMADTLLVSDYNHNNSDYYLKQRNVIKVGSYKPEYLDPNNFDPLHRTLNRTGSVKATFKQGIQGIIKSIICQQPPTNGV